MAAPYLKPIDHPSAWKASDFRSLADITLRLTDRHIDVLERAYDEVQRRGLTLDQIEAEHFRLPEIADDLAAIRREVMEGRGIVILDRLPVESWSLTKTEIIYWGIGTHFGRGNSQSVLGDRIGHVANVGGKDFNERAYRNSLPLSLHTDASDILAMLSIRTADRGGDSQYASALTVHNIMLEERPDLLEPLYRGFHCHRFGEQGPGEAPITEHRVPVLSERQGYVSCRYVAAYINMAAEEMGMPLSPQERAALDYFDAVAMRPEVMIQFQQQPGHLLICDNNTTLHARTGFEDRPGPETGRLLLRLWLTAHEADRRPTDPDIEIYSTIGIAKRDDRADTYYRGKATEGLKEGRLNY